MPRGRPPPQGEGQNGQGEREERAKRAPQRRAKDQQGEREERAKRAPQPRAKDQQGEREERAKRAPQPRAKGVPVWTVVLPVKRLGVAKTRLRGATDGVPHERLVLAMTLDTVAAVL